MRCVGKGLRLKNLLLLFLIVLGASNVAAWRCGTTLIEEGNRKREVLNACGNPSARYAMRVPFELEIGVVHERRRYQAIDYWVYIRGANKFVRIIYFEDGRLKTIRQGDYGRAYDRDPENCQRENINIERNQTKPELELRCGPPDSVQVIEEYSRPVILGDANRLFKKIVVDEWLYYNDDKLWVYRFENGVLKHWSEEDPEIYESFY